MGLPKANDSGVRGSGVLSLSTRLQAGIVALVALVALLLSLFYVERVAGILFESAEKGAESSVLHVKNVLVARVGELTPARQYPERTLNETREAWARIIRTDKLLRETLVTTMASQRSLVDVVVYDSNRKVLAAASASPGSTARSLRRIPKWREMHPGDRLDQLSRREDYAVELSLGAGGQPMFTIQAIVSSVLIAYTIEPQIVQLAVVSLAALLLAVMIAFLFSNLVTRPLAHFAEYLDRIASDDPDVERGAPEYRSREFINVHSKLRLLGQKFRGARQDVIELRSNIEQMLDRLEETVLLFDAEGKLLSAGRAAERLLGDDFSASGGKRYDEVLSAQPELIAAIRRAYESRVAVRELPVRIGTTEEPSHLLSADVLELGPRRSAVLVTLRDVTTRRQIQSELDITARLAAISRVTSGVTHEIKNPLNAMTLHLQILRERLAGSDEDITASVEVIDAEIRRLERVVKTFLDFTRPIEPQMTEVDATMLVREVAELLKPEAERKGLAIEVARGGGLSIRGDADLLKQAVLNIMKNGLEVMEPGGVLSASVVHAGPDVQIAISDQGPGIDPSVRDRIFSLYYTTKPGGSGIGLAMCFQVVQLHGGTIDFTSTPGAGTTFRLRFSALKYAAVPQPTGTA